MYLPGTVNRQLVASSPYSFSCKLHLAGSVLPAFLLQLFNISFLTKIILFSMHCWSRQSVHVILEKRGGKKTRKNLKVFKSPTSIFYLFCLWYPFLCGFFASPLGVGEGFLFLQVWEQSEAHKAFILMRTVDTTFAFGVVFYHSACCTVVLTSGVLGCDLYSGASMPFSMWLILYGMHSLVLGLAVSPSSLLSQLTIFHPGSLPDVFPRLL